MVRYIPMFLFFYFVSVNALAYDLVDGCQLKTFTFDKTEVSYIQSQNDEIVFVPELKLAHVRAQATSIIDDTNNQAVEQNQSLEFLLAETETSKKAFEVLDALYGATLGDTISLLDTDFIVRGVDFLKSTSRNAVEGRSSEGSLNLTYILPQSQENHETLRVTAMRDTHITLPEQIRIIYSHPCFADGKLSILLSNTIDTDDAEIVTRLGYRYFSAYSKKAIEKLFELEQQYFQAEKSDDKNSIRIANEAIAVILENLSAVDIEFLKAAGFEENGSTDGFGKELLRKLVSDQIFTQDGGLKNDWESALFLPLRRSNLNVSVLPNILAVPFSSQFNPYSGQENTSSTFHRLQLAKELMIRKKQNSLIEYSTKSTPKSVITLLTETITSTEVQNGGTQLISIEEIK